MRAWKWLLPCVYTNMFLQIWTIISMVWTIRTRKWLFPSVNPEMSCEMGSISTDIWTVYTFKGFQSFSVAVRVPQCACWCSLAYHFTVITQPYLLEMGFSFSQRSISDVNILSDNIMIFWVIKVTKVVLMAINNWLHLLINSKDSIASLAVILISY